MSFQIKNYLISFFSNIYRRRKYDDDQSIAGLSHYLQHAVFLLCRWKQSLWFIGGIELVQTILW